MDPDEGSSCSDDIICHTESSAHFDLAIGHIEEIILSEKFENLRNNFLEKNWHIFENSEENKLEYMDVFQEYARTFESFLTKEIERRMSQFDIEQFSEELDKNLMVKDALIQNGEIYELLLSFTNFETFKETMLDYKQKKEGLTEHMDFNILIIKSINPTENDVSDANDVIKKN